MFNTRDWQPPVAGSEVEHLLGSLNRLRMTFRWKADDLDSAGLNHRLPSSDLTIGGLLNHLARVEDGASSVRLDGSARDAYWDGRVSDDDPEFSTAAHDEPDELYRRYDDAVRRAQQRFDAAIADGGLDQDSAVQWPDGRMASLRRLLFDLLEEYGRHTGHTDLLRESIDGRIGEDPPADWSSVSPRRRVPGGGSETTSSGYQAPNLPHTAQSSAAERFEEFH